MDPLTLTIQIIQAAVVLIFAIGMIVLSRAVFRIMRSLAKIEAMIDAVARDAGPALDRARAIGENLNFIVMSVRKEVDRVSDTIAIANDRLEEALDAADERVQELGALIDVVQGEVEQTVLSATSTLRGIRTTAKVLRKGANTLSPSRSDDKPE